MQYAIQLNWFKIKAERYRRKFLQQNAIIVFFLQFCRQDTELEGLVIGDDVGLRLKVMQFWKCSESGLASQVYDDGKSEPLKIVIAESLPNLSKRKYMFDFEKTTESEIGWFY